MSNRFVEAPPHPKCLGLKKVILIIGTLLCCLKMAIITVILIMLLYFNILYEKPISSFWIVPFIILAVLLSAIAELCGLFGTVLNRIGLLKCYIVYGVLELAYLGVQCFLAAHSISIVNYDLSAYKMDHDELVYFWQNRIFALFRAVLWYALVLWFMRDLATIEQYHV